MKNQIINISKNEYQKIKEGIDLSSTFLAEIDGSQIKTVSELFEALAQAYDFQTLNGTWGKNWAAFDDLMTDLDWIPFNNHILSIKHYDELLSSYPAEKSRFIHYLKNSVLPYWEEEVLQCVVEGQAKEFTVYLID